jgi:VWFA-related protein
MALRLIAGTTAAAALSILTAAAYQETTTQPPARQRPPVFRAGATYVRVDAYPTLDGRIIQGLTKDDFELFEDGKPQTIAATEFVAFSAPDDARGSMLSAREGLELAADPHYRVVVIVLDRAVFDLPQWRTTREDLHDFLDSQVGPRDLVGLITTDRPWTDLVLGRRIQTIEDEIDTPEWLHAEAQEPTAVLQGCGELEGLRGRIRADETYTLLERIIGLLGQVREDRTSLVFVSNGVSRTAPDRHWGERRKVSMPPKIGLVNGRIQRIPRASAMHDMLCESEGHRLADTDFDRRFSDLVASARAANVAFYPVAVPIVVPLMPGGRASFPARGGLPFPTMRLNRLPDTLRELANDTTGYLIPGGGDVREGLRRVMSEAGPHYLLGYYTTNNKRDGKVRVIKVRLKKNGADIQARRYYRGPAKKEDLAASSAPRPDGPVGPPPPVAEALGALSRLRSSTQFFTYSAVAGKALNVVIEVPPAAVQAGRWKDGAALEVLAEADSGEVVGTGRARLTPNGRAALRVPIESTNPPATVLVRLRADGESVVERTTVASGPSTLVEDPLAYRSGPRGLAIPVALFEFTREERLKLDWPVLQKLDRFEIRLLDRNGQPLRHRVSVTQQDGASGPHLVADLSFTALGRGDYVVELTAAAAADTARKLLAFRIK